MRVAHEKAMAHNITMDTLAQLVEERAQGIAQKMATKDELREIKALVHEVLALVKNIDGGMQDIKTSTASSLAVATIDVRVDAREADMKRVKEQVKR
jgi:hypothetical protein